MAARKLFLVSVSLLVAPIITLAADPPDPIILSSDTTTEWFDLATNSWLAAVRVLPHPSWPPLSGSHWVWNMRSASDQQRREGATIEFRRTFTLPEARTGTLTIMADNEVTARLNGTEIIHTSCDFTDPPSCMQAVPIEAVAGNNELTFTVINWPKPGATSTQNPAGFIYQANFDQIVLPPEPEKPDPIVLVPGMMASLNNRKIFSDFNGGAWDFGPGTRNFYQALIDQFESQGFEENKTLFVAHYDWRNPVSDAATNYLKPTIDQAKEVAGAEKVDIVAHSMGGLVSRSYIQSADYGNDVDQLITMGTPHFGAADAYSAWEGGQIPERWDTGIRVYLFMVESALKIRRFVPTAPFLDRPTTFRLFFPSLKDLLPINDYVTRDENQLNISQHTEQNPFLQRLRDTVSLLNSVEITSIAGTNLGTLNQVPIKSTRTPEDISRERWRDGHPNPDPLIADSNNGDETVLLSSALFGTNTLTLDGTKHMKLPEEAQEEVLEALGLDSSGPHIAYDAPDSLVGTVVLSPVVPSITFPDGTVFTCDANKQVGSAECVVDETDPNGPKLLVIADPAAGKYILNFTGTGDGEYHAITCFADEDSDNCSTRVDTTQPGQVDTSTFAIGDGTYIAPAGDLLALLEQLKETTQNLIQEKHLKPTAHKLHGMAASLADHGQEYVEAVETFGLTSPEAQELYQKIKKDFARFQTELEKQIAAGNLDETAILEITSLRDQITDTGL